MSEILKNVYFKLLHDPQKEESLGRELVNLVINHAKKVIAHPSRPLFQKFETFDRAPFGDLALEESIEESPLMDQAEDFLVEYPVEKPFSCVTLLDCSSSMSGEKHLLASIAVAVLLLEVSPPDSSLLVFASDVLPIKKFLHNDPVEETIGRFLKTRPKGFTNIAKALEAGLKQWATLGTHRRRVGLLASDGRATDGENPLDFARQYDYLVVLHLHGPGSHLDASKEMAQLGHGVCLEVETFQELPRRMYEALRMIARV